MPYITRHSQTLWPSSRWDPGCEGIQQYPMHPLVMHSCAQCHNFTVSKERRVQEGGSVNQRIPKVWPRLDSFFRSRNSNYILFNIICQCLCLHLLFKQSNPMNVFRCTHDARPYLSLAWDFKIRQSCLPVQAAVFAELEGWGTTWKLPNNVFFFGNTMGFTCCSELCCQFCATKTRGAKETQSCKLSLETSHKVAPATEGQMLLVWSATWRHANRSCVWWFGNPSSSTRHLRGEQSGVHSEYQVPTSHMPPGKEWDKLASAWQNKKCATLPHICRNWKARTIMHTHTLAQNNLCEFWCGMHLTRKKHSSYTWQEWVAEKTREVSKSFHRHSQS